MGMDRIVIEDLRGKNGDPIDIPSDNIRVAPLSIGGMCRIVPGGKYKRSKAAIIRQIQNQMPPLYVPITNWVHVYIYIATWKDLSNVAKVLLDSLQEAGVFKDDKQVVHLVMNKHRIKRTGRERVEIQVTEEYQGDMPIL